jgi:hypothetical protein
VLKRDIASLTELHKILVTEIDNLKSDVKTKGFGFIKASGGSGEQPNVGKNAEEEVFLLKTQNESLAAKININNTKLANLEDTLDNKLQDMFEDMQKKNPDYIMNQKIGAVEKDFADLKKDL